MTHKMLRLPKAETKEQWLKDREPFHWEVRRGHTPMVVPGFGRKYWLRAWGLTGGIIYTQKKR